MAKQRVQIFQAARGVEVETNATIGAVVGVNLTLPDGTVVTQEMLGIGADPGEEFPNTYWRLILEIPPNVVALAETATTGLYAITGAGTSATREIQPTVGRTTVGNGDGVLGDPTIDLAVLLDSGVGAGLVKITRDAWGRVSGTQAATTDDLVEGLTNLYFTDVRAQDAVVVQTITNGDTTHAPSGDAVFDLIAGLGPYQPLDATLSALAAANWADNALPIGSGADTMAQVAFAANTFPARASAGSLSAKSITDFGLSLVDDAAAVNARSTLGLVIGTNVQAWDADLDAWALIAPSSKADDSSVVHRTGSLSETVTGHKTFSDFITCDSYIESGGPLAGMQVYDRTNASNAWVIYSDLNLFRWYFLGADRFTLSSGGVLNMVGGSLQRSGVQVVGARVTGWNAPTGTLTRGTFNSGATLAVTAQTLAALITDLRTHGLINT